MYLKCQGPINPKFPLCQLPIRANSKNKTEDFVYWRSVLLFRLAPLLLHIVKHGSNVGLIGDRCKNPTTFIAKYIGFQQLNVV